MSEEIILNSYALVGKQTTQVPTGLAGENRFCEADYDKGYFKDIFNDSTLRRQRQEDLYEFKASLDYIASSRPLKTT